MADVSMAPLERFSRTHFDAKENEFRITNQETIRDGHSPARKLILGSEVYRIPHLISVSVQYCVQCHYVPLTALWDARRSHERSDEKG